MWKKHGRKFLYDLLNIQNIRLQSYNILMFWRLITIDPNMQTSEFLQYFLNYRIIKVD